MEFLSSPEFWIALGQIIIIDILLGGDNAVVIALACRKLPPAQRTKGIIWGTAGAIILRVILIAFAMTLLALPFLKFVGALLLVWIGVKLLAPDEEGHGNVEGSDKLFAAIKTIIVADLVMSVDNVIAIAGAAQNAGEHQMLLVVLGLLISIPIIVWGSQLVIKLMDRFPVIITLGGMLLGWIAGQMVVTDPVLKDWMATHSPYLKLAASAAGALFVLVFGKWLAARSRAARALPAQAAAAPQLNRLQRVLLAVDGSDNAAQAVRYVIGVREDLRDPQALAVHLLNVQRPVSGEISRFVPGENLKDYHLEASEAALAPARALLDAAGLEFHEHRRVGEPAPTIAAVARETGSDLVVMGTRGLGGVAAGLVGSVAQAAVAQCGVPVLLVK